MKTFMISLFAFFIGLTAAMAQTGSLDAYFKKYQNDDGFTVVNISSSMFAAISGLDSDALDPEIKAILDNITGMKVLSRQSDGASYFDEAMTMINGKGLSELMTIKEKGENVRIYGKSDGSEHLKEIIMLRGEKNNFILMQVQGKLTIQQLSKISKILNK